MDCPVGLSIAAQKGLEMTPDKVIITITAEGMGVPLLAHQLVIK